MSQIPLGLADFVIAFPVAKIAFTRDYEEWERQRAYTNARDAANEGLARVREFRGVKRLPRGSSDLRARIISALMRGWDRRCARRKWSDREHWSSWEHERRPRLLHSANYALARVWDHRLRDAYGGGALRGVDLDADADPHLSLGYYYTDVDLTVRPDYVTTVIGPGLIVVSQRLILSADPIRDFAMPFGVRAAWRVQYAEPFENVNRYSLSNRICKSIAGVVLAPEGQEPYLAPGEALAYGALMHGTAAYRKARRRSA